MRAYFLAPTHVPSILRYSWARNNTASSQTKPSIKLYHRLCTFGALERGYLAEADLQDLGRGGGEGVWTRNY